MMKLNCFYEDFIITICALGGICTITIPFCSSVPQLDSIRLEYNCFSFLERPNCQSIRFSWQTSYFSSLLMWMDDRQFWSSMAVHYYK